MEKQTLMSCSFRQTSAAQGLHTWSSGQGHRSGYAPSPAPAQDMQSAALLSVYKTYSPLRTRSKSRAGANEVQVQEATSRIEDDVRSSGR
ncbi:hypothetical protein OBBRIDRAFT_796629 [Obba rivulosa]|uniref:Uncharacterized protein n=1 Tax=Obba rivulosa TaxID=1052685 RepID=A0A8E2ALT5_9APHY|nr:hypothetical protein OBBRIDRAFT_796629 [Obba rivulosa]